MEPSTSTSTSLILETVFIKWGEPESIIKQSLSLLIFKISLNLIETSSSEILASCKPSIAIKLDFSFVISSKYAKATMHLAPLPHNVDSKPSLLKYIILKSYVS